MKKNWFTTKKVHENVYAIAEFNHWEKVVSYLLIGNKKAYLIDTGMGYQSINSVVKKLTNKPITVLLTHAHWDHIGSVSKFKDIHIYDNNFEKESLGQGFNSKEIVELIEAKNFDNNFVIKEYHASGVRKFNLMKDGDIFADEKFSIKVIHTPGHTPGSVCFFIPELRLLFTGDTLYPGPLYAQLPESNLEDFFLSIKKLISLSNKVSSIFPGHNEVIMGVNLITEAQKVLESDFTDNKKTVYFLT